MTATVTSISKGRKDAPPPEAPDEVQKPSAMLLDASDERLTQRLLPTSTIVEGDNARVERDAEKQKELNASVKVHGILSPVLVRPLDDGSYQIIAGERRFIAAKANKLEQIPVLVLSSDDQDSYVKGLIENIQREDLDPIDEARGFQKLLETPRGDGKKMTQSELAKAIGKSQPYVSNAIRLLQLPEEVLAQVSSGEMTVGVAKAIITLPKESQARVSKAAVKGRYTAQQVEAEARHERDREARAQADKSRESKAVDALAAAIRSGTKDGSIPEGAALLVYGESHATALSKRKLPTTTFDNRTHRIKNGRVSCDCSGFLVTVQTYSEPMTTEVAKVCLVPEHVEKAMAEERAKAEAEARTQVESVNEARTIVLGTLRDGTEQLTPLGLRFTLYHILTNDDRDQYQRIQSLTSFRERHKLRHLEQGMPSTFGIWPAILELPLEKVVYEILALGITAALPNVYADRMRYENQRHAEVRQWYVDNHKLDPSIVWGGHEPIEVSWVEERVQAAQTVHEFTLDEEWVAEARSEWDPGDLDEEDAKDLFETEVIANALCKVCLGAGEEVDKASHADAMAALEGPDPDDEDDEDDTDDEPSEKPALVN